MDDLQHLIMKDQGPVTEVVLNRPEKRNALSLDLMTEVISGGWGRNMRNKSVHRGKDLINK